VTDDPWIVARRAKDPTFVIRSEDPFCGGPPLSRLVERPLTWREDFFVRSHGPIPRADPEGDAIVVDGLVSRPGTLTLDELVGRLPRREAVVTLVCAGNRRDELMAVAPIPGELAWSADAVGTARWSGVSLADLLGMVGVREPATDVWMEGRDRVPAREGVVRYGASIALGRALAGDVLLADRMNGVPLPQEHGAPLRVVVPGFIAARSVKWLARITLADRPSDNPFQAWSYKLLAAGDDPATADRSQLPSIEEAPHQAVICRPAVSATIPAGILEVVGYATAGGHRRVSGVEVSPDGARSWVRARLLDRPAAGTWSRWSAEVLVAAGEQELVARQVDASGPLGAPDPRDRWNPLGYLNDAWHRVHVRVVA
jgi:sulfite oxidase